MLAWMLVIIVVLLITDVVIMTCWEVTDPLFRTLSHYRDQPQYQCGGTITTETFRANIDVVEHCVCTKLSAWLVLVLIIKGSIVLFGTFMAWQTRKVYIRQLNDTQHCAVCMISISVCTAIGLVCAFTVARYPNIYYGVIGSLVLLSTTIILLWLFIHKIVRVQCKPTKGKLITVGESSDASYSLYCGAVWSKYCPCCTVSCLVTWCPCFPFCSPYTCCRSPCFGSQVHPDSSQHKNEVDFYIAGKGQSKDAEIVLLKQTIEAKNEELKILRSEHGTVTQVATQTGDWYADDEDGNRAGQTTNFGSGSDSSRRIYQSNRNNFKIFNQRMDFSHVQSKVDTGVHKSHSPSLLRHGRPGDEQDSLWDPVRRNSRLLATTANTSVRLEKEISKLKLILAQKENDIQHLLNNLDSVPSGLRFVKTTQRGISTQNVENSYFGKEHVLDEDSHKLVQEKEDQCKKKESRGKKYTEFESPDPQSTKHVSIVLAPATPKEGLTSVTKNTHSQSPSTVAHSAAAGANSRKTSTNSLKEGMPNVALVKDNTAAHPTSNQNGSSQRSSIPDSNLSDRKQEKHTKKVSITENGNLENTNDKLIDEENKNASWLGLKHLPLVHSQTNNGKRNPTPKEIENVNRENLGKEGGETKRITLEEKYNDTITSGRKYFSKGSENSETSVIESSGYIEDDHHDGEYYFRVKQKSNHQDVEEEECEEEEDFDIEPIDEESEGEGDENESELDLDDGQGVSNISDSATMSHAARSRKRLRNPGGRLNWNAESKVKSTSEYKPRRSEKKIKTYKLDYSNAKSRLYNSSKFKNSIDDSEIHPRIQKKHSNLDYPNVRPKLYGSSSSLAQMVAKPIQQSSRPEDTKGKTFSYSPNGK